MGSLVRLTKLLGVMFAAGVLAGCSGGMPSLPKVTDLNPFKEKQTPLPGKRIAILPEAEKIPGELASGDKPIVLVNEHENDAWAQPGGEPTNAPGHLALAAAVQKSWSADAGTGSGKVGRVTASPIIFGEKIFTLDANGTVSAFALSGGSSAWRVSLVPEKERTSAGSLFSLGGGSSANGGYGGGLAADSGRIYAASGFGNVVALDPQNGKKLWERNLSVPIRAAPTAKGDRVFVIAIDGRFYCLSGVDGSELWTARGLPQQASIVMSVSPAVAGDVVVVPYPTGDLVALKVSDGSAVWSESLSSSRLSSQLNTLAGAARPAIDNGTVFAVGHAGRMVATQVSNGERLWSLNVASTQTPWVAGGSVFVVDTSGQLLAVKRDQGTVQWTTQLPDDKTWAGPVLAGGKLWLVSSKGALVGVDALTGRVASQQNLGDPVFVAPVVAKRRMFVLTDSAKLIALN